MDFLSIDIYTISTLVGSATYIALGSFVYFRVSRRSSEVKHFILVCFLYSIYNISLAAHFIMFRMYKNVPNPPERVLLCIHFSNIIGSFLPIVYAGFLLTFANRRPRWYWGIYGINVIISALIVWHERTNELLKGTVHYYHTPFRLLFPFAVSFFFVVIVWAAISLRLAYRDTDSPVQRRMLRFLFWGAFLLFPAAFSDMAYMAQNKGIFPFSAVVGLGHMVYFSYAIVKYRFLGVRVSFRKSLTYIMLIVPITTFFFAAAVISYNFAFGVEAVSFSPLILLWAFLAAIVFYLIRERLEVFIDRVMFKQSYQYQRSLEKLENDIIKEVDPNSLVSKLVVWLEGALSLEYVDILLLKTRIGGNKQYFATVRSDEEAQVKQISDNSLLVRYLRERQETIFRADLPVLPQFREICYELDSEFQALSAEVCVPLMSDRLLFSVDLKFQIDLQGSNISDDLRAEFNDNRIPLSNNVSISVKEKDRKWLISDENSNQIYAVIREDGKLNVYTSNKLNGIIVCGNRKHGKFEEADRRLLGIAAYTIAFAVERAQLVLELKSANQFKWDLVRWLSHDLNTPLTPIKIIVNALGRKVIDSEEDQQAISVVMGEIARLQGLISSIDFIADLDVASNRAHTEYRPMDLGSLLTEVVALFEWQARESGITLSCRVSPDVSPVRGDANRMKQALVNLISNSVKYNRPGGRVDITVTQTNGNVVANIVDTGIGISQTESALIFEPFYRGNKAQATGKGGVGLGLAIVKRIVEEHGGAIQLQSELDVGTSISLIIPCDPETGKIPHTLEVENHLSF